MARHFKTEMPDQPSQGMGDLETLSGETSVQEVPRRHGRSRQNTTSLPYGQAASYHYSYPTAVPTSDFYGEDVEARGGIRSLGRAILLLLAWAFRIVALALSALVIANVFQLRIGRPYLTYVTDLVTSYLPWARFTVLGLDTPFGGTFRGDLSILCLLAFLFDWALCRARAQLR